MIFIRAYGVFYTYRRSLTEANRQIFAGICLC